MNVNVNINVNVIVIMIVTNIKTQLNGKIIELIYSKKKKTREREKKEQRKERKGVDFRLVDFCHLNIIDASNPNQFNLIITGFLCLFFPYFISHSFFPTHPESRAHSILSITLNRDIFFS